MVFKVSMEKEYEKEMNIQEGYSESSDDTISTDMQRAKPNYPSDVLPNDYYEYRRFVNLPESQAEFEGKIDKDIVFANLGGKKPDIEEMRFEIGTIELFEGEFVEEIEIKLKDNDGNDVYDIHNNIVKRKILIFDEAFRSCLNYLKAEFKFSAVASRALGINDRASVLDITTNARIQKEFAKKKDQNNRLFGTGGM